MKDFYPMKLSGIIKETIWGGSRISDSFGVDCSDTTGELWVLSARPREDCVILNGKHKGLTITEFIRSHMPSLDPFPLLIKFIDANDRLSVQVHPNDLIAASLGGGAAGKTEMWHIIDAAPDATIVYGIKDGISKDDLKAAVDQGRVEDVLNYISVKAGDTFFIPAGLVHAIGKGILLAEVQQNSDTTYRFYDYGRTDAAGNPRELHVEKALSATMILNEKEINDIRYSSGYDSRSLADCDYFNVTRVSVDGKYQIDMKDHLFCSLLCLSGNAAVVCSDMLEGLSAGDSYFIPQGSGEITVDGKAEILISISKNKA